MSESTTPEQPEEVTAGWLFMTANALGLSDADLAYVLGVREDTVRKNWKYGTQPIPDGVRDDLRKFVEFTDACVDVIASRAEDLTEPAVIVFQNLRDVPEGHMAGTYGITWWDHVAFSARKTIGPELYVGTPFEVARAYDYTIRQIAGLPAVDPAVHDDPAVLGLHHSVRRQRPGRPS
jgi:hypothetical protein